MNIIEANELLQHSYGPPPKGAFDDDDVKAVEGVKEHNEIFLLKEYKLTQQAMLQSLAIAEKDTIRAENQVEETAVATGTKPLEDTLAAIEVNNNSNTSINAIPLKDGNNFNEKGNENSQEDESEE